MESSKNSSTCNCRNREACPLKRQNQIAEVVYEGTLASNQPNYKEKSILELPTILSFRNEFHINDAKFSKEL